MASGRPKNETAGIAPARGNYNGNGQLGFEAELFKAADKLRGNMEPSDLSTSPSA
jgi:hypothetical protein